MSAYNTSSEEARVAQAARIKALERERDELRAALERFTSWESGWRMEEADYLEAHPSNAGLVDHRIRFGVPREESLQAACVAARALLRAGGVS